MYLKSSSDELVDSGVLRPLWVGLAGGENACNSLPLLSFQKCD